MKGKGKESDYIITRLFATDYFHYYSNPALFAAYFLPFIAYGKGRAYYESEFEEKISNIRDKRHGNFYNYATQGFGNVAFYNPDITFDYFYNRLCSYDSEKNRHFKVQGIMDLESSIMRKDILCVLQKDKLLLKRNFPVLDVIKKELVNDLLIHENKYVLAKMLYYIVHEQHMLPDVASETQMIIANTVGFTFDCAPNVCMGFRKSMDEDIKTLSDRMRFASDIQLLALDGISLFGNENVSLNLNGLLVEDLERISSDNSKIKIEIIVSEAGTITNSNACRYQVNLSHLQLPKEKLAQYTLDRLLKLKRQLKNGLLGVKTTSLPLPYALFIVCFEDETLDYIKVDLYSPFLSENSDRPTLYILRRTNPNLFVHFKNVFENMWKNDDFSQFIIF